AFLAGETTTAFLAEHPRNPETSTGERTLALIAAALARYRADAAGGPGYWRNNPGAPAPWRFELDGHAMEMRLWPKRRTPGAFSATLPAGETIEVIPERYDGVEMALVVDGIRRTFVVAAHQGVWWVQTGADVVRMAALPLLPEPRRAAEAAGSLRAPLPGRVAAVLVEPGQTVEEGQPLIKLEAMKMEYTIRAATSGVVDAVCFAAGDQVKEGETLIRIAD
ncbi:MAG TPA: biotin/lipoyl-binding protein, partial [Promineifilum sp.]|nr:biotin/lipoyl-binding protein [Promineifilum sp.]